MEIYTGRTISDGIAIGKVKIYRKRKRMIVHTDVVDAEAEVRRFEAAKEVAIEQLRALYEKAAKEIGGSNATIFRAHWMMLEDEDYNASIYEMIRNGGMNVECAVAKTGDKFFRMFAEMEDEYLKARAEDVKDVSECFVEVLAGANDGDVLVEDSVILVAGDFVPSEMVQIDKTKLRGVVTLQGSKNSHTAILARTMNIPALMGIEPEEAWDGQMAVVDGGKGILVINPDEFVLEEYKKEKNREKETRKFLAELKGKPTVTSGGREIKLYANIGSIDDVAHVLANDAAGIGLFRTEFLYLEKGDYLSEEEQFLVYKTVVQDMAGKPVIIRTLDVRGDKQAAFFRMGTEVLRTQLRAIYRASAFGTISLMFPMIRFVPEVQGLKEICEEIKAELDEDNIPYGEVKLGIMVETKDAVEFSAQLAREVAFISIGTNDLTQDVLGIDRENPKYDGVCDKPHSTIMQMIQKVIDNGHKEGCPVGICGELAADIRLTEIFVNMGVDELSVSPSCILPIRKIIREM